MDLDQAKKLLQDNNYDAFSIGRDRAAKLFGVSRNVARRTIEKLRSSDTPKQEAKESVAYSWTESKDELKINIPKTRIKSLEELLTQFKVDTEKWEIKEWKATASEMGGFQRATGSDVDGWKRLSGDPVVTPLYHVTATFKPKLVDSVDFAKKEIEALIEDAKSRIKRYDPLIKDCALRTGPLVEISIPDLHYNKLAWGGETGFDNWDSKISESTFESALDCLVANTAHYKPSRYWFVVGNDLFNSDNVDDLTTAGTPQDSDSRYYKIFVKVRELMTRSIEKLRLLAPVDVIIMPGNHDEHTAWHLGDSLECLFAKCDDVTVDNRPLFRKCYQYGKNMVMFTHGDRVNHKDLPIIMATENPKMFGDTKFREIHMGHLHKESSKTVNNIHKIYRETDIEENRGIKTRILPSLCQPDVFHAKHGYVGNIRSAEAFVWDANRGMIGTVMYNDIEKE